MRGTSAHSLGVVEQAVAAAGGDLAAVGRELFGAAAAIDGAPALRRVLTDPSTESDAKVALAASVFSGKVAAPTLDVVSAAVGGRWASGRDFTDALEIGGVAAVIRGAGDAADRLDTELFEAERVIVTTPELRRVVEDRTIAADAKASLLADVFGQKVSPAALTLLQQASAARSGSFEKVLTRFSDQVAGARGAVIADVTVAYQLDDAESTRLSSALSRRYGDRPVQLNVVVDPAVVGGISVSVAGEVVDATMSTRLEDARRQLAG